MSSPESVDPWNNRHSTLPQRSHSSKAKKHPSLLTDPVPHLMADNSGTSSTESVLSWNDGDPTLPRRILPPETENYPSESTNPVPQLVPDTYIIDHSSEFTNSSRDSQDSLGVEFKKMKVRGSAKPVLFSTLPKTSRAPNGLLGATLYQQYTYLRWARACYPKRVEAQRKLCKLYLDKEEARKEKKRQTATKEMRIEQIASERAKLSDIITHLSGGVMSIRKVTLKHLYSPWEMRANFRGLLGRKQKAQSVEEEVETRAGKRKERSVEEEVKTRARKKLKNGSQEILGKTSHEEAENMASNF